MSFDFKQQWIDSHFVASDSRTVVNGQSVTDSVHYLSHAAASGFTLGYIGGSVFYAPELAPVLISEAPDVYRTVYSIADYLFY